MAIKLVGILAVTRLIGPEAYGLFAAVAVVTAVLATLAVFGIDVQLVRSSRGSAADDTAFVVLVGSSILIGGLAALGAPLLGSWLQADGAVAPMRTVAAFLPLMAIGAPARARLERELRFDAVARIELSADIAVYAVSIPLAVAGAGVWAPIVGLLARNAVLVTTSYRAARYVPRLMIDREELVAMARFGTGYSAAKWLSLIGDLVNPIVVGRVLGPVGVGHVAVASRIVEQLGAAKQATMRLAVAAFARLGDDRARLRAAHAEGVLVQVVGSVPLYASAAFLAPWFIPFAFGSDWAPAAEVLGLLAIAASIGTLFNLGPPLLQVLGRNGPVVWLRGLQVSSLLGFTLMLVPALGVVGYGLAQLIRTVPFLTVQRELLRWFRPNYRSGGRWVGALLPMMTAAWWPAALRPVLLVGPIVLLSLPSTRREVRYVVGHVIGRRPS